MSAPLKDLPPGELRLRIEGTRRRLEDWARRLAALRERVAGAAVDEASGPEGSGAERAAAVPLFHQVGAVGGALDDVELNFEVLDTEDPGREGR
jgi:hypothetical protein